MASVHRVVISHEVYQALQAEALFKESSIQETLNTLVLSNISQEAKKIIGMLSEKEHVDVKTLKPQSHISKESGRPKQLAKDAAGIARIKELWPSGMTIADIARDIGRPRQTTESVIKKLISKGELPPRAEPGTKSGEEV